MAAECIFSLTPNGVLPHSFGFIYPGFEISVSVKGETGNLAVMAFSFELLCNLKSLLKLCSVNCCKGVLFL